MASNKDIKPIVVNKLLFLNELDKILFYNNLLSTSNKSYVYKVKFYKEQISKISSIDSDIISLDDVSNIRIKEKLKEFYNNNTIKNVKDLQIEANDTDEKLINEHFKNKEIKDTLMKIYGVGETGSEKFIKAGITSIEDLKLSDKELKDKFKISLTKNQKIGIKYYEDINKRIERKDIDLFKELFEQIFKESILELHPGIDETSNYFNDYKFQITGSYRRGSPNSGDIDLYLTSISDNRNIYSIFVENLKKRKILIEILSSGNNKTLAIGKLNETSNFCRIDILYTSPNEYPFALLYFTGSADFNVAMRKHALTMNYTLNEHGLSKNNSGKDKVDHVFKNEEDIFKFLNMKYKEPHERIDSKSIELLTGTDNSKSQKPANANANASKTSGITLKASTKLTSTKFTTTKTLKKSKENVNNIYKNIKNFKENGVNTIDKISEQELIDMFKTIINQYYNSIQINESNLPLGITMNDVTLSDNEYDILRDYAISKYPDNQLFVLQHAAITDLDLEEVNKDKDVNKDVNKDKDIILKVDKQFAKLPYEMWSMDKIKPDTNSLTKYKMKYGGPYVISAKLDGVSGLYTTEESVDGLKSRLYTRGSGVTGQVINHLIPYLKLPVEKDLVIRGEFIIKKSVFDSKYKDKFSNSRNFVIGIINKKKFKKEDIEIIKDIDFVAYEVIKPFGLKPSEQFNKLEQFNLEKINMLTAKYITNIQYDELTNDYLSEKLTDWRENYEYQIDGIICSNDEVYERTSGNPEHSFAFKSIISDSFAEAKIININWNPSKSGLLKPQIQIEPVTIQSTQIQFITGNNAKFIENNKLGLGAVVKVIKAGDIIPKIESVILPAEKIMYPNVNYKWDDKHVELMLVDNETDEVKIKQIMHFFKILQVESMGRGNISKIINSKHANSIEDILKFTKDDFQLIEGIKDKLSSKIYNSIKDRLQFASLETIAAASNIFGNGFGVITFQTILNEEPNIFIQDVDKESIIKSLKNINNIGNSKAKKFADSYNKFKQFMKNSNLEYKFHNYKSANKIVSSDSFDTSDSSDSSDSSDVNVPESLSKKNIVLSDFNKSKYTKNQFIKKLNLIGINEAYIKPNITEDTDILIVGDINSNSTKVKQAKKHKKINIISATEFEKKYFND